MKRTERITINRTPEGNIEFITIETVTDDQKESYTAEELEEYAKSMCEKQRELISDNLPSFPNKHDYIKNAPFPDFECS